MGLIIEGADRLGKTVAAEGIVSLAATRAVKGMIKLNNNEDESSIGVGELPLPINYRHLSRQNESFDYGSHYGDLISTYAVNDRFHLSSLAYQVGSLSYGNLRLIESWLGCVGSYTVVLYATDDEWYRSILEDEPDYIDSRMEANSIYRQMANWRYKFPVHIDEAIVVGPEVGYPTGETLDKILTSWFTLLNAYLDV